MEPRVYQSSVYNVDELKQRLVHVWHCIDHSIIDNAIDEWHDRLRDCVWAKGEHFELRGLSFSRVTINVSFVSISICISVILSKFELYNFPR